MAFPYSSGDVLTAADLNASTGLVLIDEVTVTNSNTATLSGVFSSTYDTYVIVITDLVRVGGTVVSLMYRYLTGTTERTASDYRWAYSGLLTTGTASDSNNNGVDYGYSGCTTSQSSVRNAAAIWTIYRPYEAVRTLATVNATGDNTVNTYSRVGMTMYGPAESHDGIRFAGDSFLGTQNMSSTFRVFGVNSG